MIGMVIGQFNEQAQEAMKLILITLCLLWVAFFFISRWKGE